MTKTVAIQGMEASFHDIAAKQYFGKDITIVACETFKDIFAALKNNQSDFAICAIENSLYGSINETYDLLLKYHFSIIGEVYLRIEQCLIGFKGTRLQDITEVYSHPVALAQCEEYIDAYLHNAKRLEFHDTAASVDKIKTLSNKHAVAIASKEASKLHGMEVLAYSIETNKQNYTRFIVIQAAADKMDDNVNKTSMIIKTSHKPGALYDALGVFAKRSINLSKLQSRPIIGKAWHYIFYVDVDAGVKDEPLKAAIIDLNKQGCDVKLLGSYKNGTIEN